MAKPKFIDIILVVLALVSAGLVGWFATEEFELAHPLWLWMGIVLVAMAAGHLFYHRKQAPSYKISSLKMLANVAPDPLGQLRSLPFALSLAGSGILILAMARPQSAESFKNRTSEGIDIILSIDLSTSMLAKDFKPNRLEASKEVAADFVAQRPNDRMGVVIYAGESLSQAPLTTDHNLLQSIIKEIDTGLLQDGTAIGLGLATAVNRLKDSEAKSKIIILLTDGVNNVGQVKPVDAAQIAQVYGIRVYTIGVGTNGLALMPAYYDAAKRIHYEKQEVKIDEETLQQIADLTEGKYFRATNKNELKSIYKEIDKLEKTRFEVTEFSTRNEEFLPFGLGGAVLLLLGFLLKKTLFRTTP